MSSKFAVGDLVWAKIRYSPDWPAKVVEPPPDNNKKNQYFVFFYGSHDYGWIEKKNIHSYEDYYNVKKDVKNNLYRQAVKEINTIYHELQLKTDEYFLNIHKRKRSEEEEEERRRKIQERLKVRLIPKTAKKNKKTRVKRTSSPSIPSSSSSCIITVNIPKTAKKNKKTREKKTSSSSIPSSSSSCIITVNVHDFQKIIKKEVCVMLERCDEGLPKLFAPNVDQQENKEEKPPTLSLEL